MNTRALLFAAALSTLFGCEVGGTPIDGSTPPGDGGADDGAVTDDAAAPSCGTPTVEGSACTTTADCNDGCFCNGIEICRSGACERLEAPCADDIECTDEVCDEERDECTITPRHELCADDDLCNGTEECVPDVGCVAGLRLSCADGDPCTIGACDPTEGCSYTVRDLDGDGYADDRCGGDDCNDDPANGASVRPDAVEVCDNGIDDDCNGLVDYRELACLATNDTCATAEMLPGPGSYVRTTRGAGGQYPLGCFAGGIDTVFQFRLDAEQNVAATVRLDTGSGAVTIRPAGSCGTGPELACGQELVARALPAGDYVAIVRTTVGTAFTLTLRYEAPTPVAATDVCGGTTDAITASGTYTGFFADVAHDYELSCRPGATARDAAYRLVLTETSDVVLTASASGTPLGATTYLSLVRDCTNPLSTIACVQRASAEVRRRTLLPGTYYVLLESSSTAAVSWTLDATITPAAMRAEGDSCATSVDITNTTVSLPLSALELDSGTGCGGATSASRDASFFFTTTDVSDVVLTTDVGATHYVSVGSACGELLAETSCTSGTPRIEQRLLRIPAGTYHVTVSTALGSGTISASARIEPPTFPPGNDTCSGATDLTDGVVVSGNLLAAGDDVVSCAGAGAADTFHRIVLTERRNVSLIARRTGGAGEPLALGLRLPSACGSSSSDVVCASGAPAFLNRTLDPGTYYVVVESGSAVGPYSLVAYLADP